MHIQTIRGNIYSYLRRTNEIVGGVADESDYTWRFNPLNQFNTMSEIEMFIIGITEQCNLRCTYCCYSGDYVNNRIHGSHTLTGRDIDDKGCCTPLIFLSFHGKGFKVLEYRTEGRENSSPSCLPVFM